MPKVQLTEKTLRRPLPASGQEELWDKIVPGFGLRIAAGGARTYFVMKRLNGKLVRRTVGKVAPPDGPLAPGELTLPEARDRARKLIDALSRGLDPDERSMLVGAGKASFPASSTVQLNFENVAHLADTSGL